MTRSFPFRAPSRTEWECPRCSAINDVEAKHCWQCGPLRESAISIGTAIAVEAIAVLLFFAAVAVWLAIMSEARGELIWNLFDLLSIGGFSPAEIGACRLEDAW